MSDLWLPADWPAPPHVHALTTLRCGGVSKGLFASMNPASHVGDDPLHVQENRRRLAEMLHLPTEPVWLEQVHGIHVVQADAVHGLVQADASYTAARGVVCAVLTADCLPLLLCTQQGTAVAAAHAGWRGLLNGVIEASITALPREPLYAWLGPAIGPQCFEVGEEVRAAFVAKSELFADAFVAQGKGKWLADIYHLARLTLQSLGVEAIYGGEYCTVSDAARFFSYRRDRWTGRMASLIWIDQIN